MDDVILQIKAAFGVADQFGASLESVTAVRQQTKARTSSCGTAMAWIERPNAEPEDGMAWLGSLVTC